MWTDSEKGTSVVKHLYAIITGIVEGVHNVDGKEEDGNRSGVWP